MCVCRYVYIGCVCVCWHVYIGCVYVDMLIGMFILRMCVCARVCVCVCVCECSIVLPSSFMPKSQLICYEGCYWSVSTFFLKTGYTKQYGITSYRTAVFSVSIEFRDKWVSERPPTWRVAANIMNKQSQTADKKRSSSLGVRRGANTCSP